MCKPPNGFELDNSGRRIVVDPVRTIFGGKNPHPNRLVGGVPCPINMHSTGAVGAINMERLTAFTRVTPTDHLPAPGRVPEQSLATLPAEKTGLAALVPDILDPCSPVRLEEAQDA